MIATGNSDIDHINSWGLAEGFGGLMRAITVILIPALFVSSSVASAEKKTPEFELLRYKLPSTSVSLKLSLTLESCQTIPIVSGDASLLADAAAAPGSFAVTVGQLQSARIKRTLNITLQDTGSIATIDSNVEDRTGSIIGNTIKFLTSVAGAFFGAGVPKAAFQVSAAANKASLCSEPIQAAIARINQIDDTLAQWRAGNLPANAKDIREQNQAINALTIERAGLRAGMLHVDLEAPLDMAALVRKNLDAPEAGWTATTQVDMTPLQKAWLKQGETHPALSATWLVKLPGNTAPPAPADQPSSLCQAKLDALDGKAICFALPMTAAFSVTAAGTNLQLKDSSFTLDAKKGFPVPQWGKLQLLSLSAGFGSNKQMSLTLNKFGQASAMKWTSEARAETATGGVAALAGQAVGVLTANNKLAREKAEIEELTTQQTLNRIRACREILDAGGSACPADAAIQSSQ